MRTPSGSALKQNMSLGIVQRHLFSLEFFNSVFVVIIPMAFQSGTMAGK